LKNAISVSDRGDISVLTYSSAVTVLRKFTNA